MVRLVVFVGILVFCFTSFFCTSFCCYICLFCYCGCVLILSIVCFFVEEILKVFCRAGPGNYVQHVTIVSRSIFFLSLFFIIHQLYIYCSYIDVYKLCSSAAFTLLGQLMFINGTYYLNTLAAITIPL